MTNANTTSPTVLITGASGLIGSRVIDALTPDYDIVALDVKPPDERTRDMVRFVEADLTSDEALGDALDDVRRRVGPRLASVIHLAAYYDFSGEPSPLYDELTVEGTRRLIRGLRERFTVEQFVFSSSLLVMKPVENGSGPGETEAADGEADEEPLDESSPEQAEWDYPRSKLKAERAIRDEHGDVPAVILRLAGAYDEWGHSPPITQQIWRIRELKLESVLFPGDPSHGQSFVHLDDVAACFRKIVDRRAELGPLEVFLVGEPDVVSYGELQDQIGELLHRHEWPTLRIPAPIAKAGAWVKEKASGDGEEFIKPWMVDLADAHYPVSIDRARERLRWEPEHRLRDVLPRMIGTLEEHPDRWYRENDLPGAEPEESEPAAGEDDR